MVTRAGYWTSNPCTGSHLISKYNNWPSSPSPFQTHDPQISNPRQAGVNGLWYTCSDICVYILICVPIRDQTKKDRDLNLVHTLPWFYEKRFSNPQDARRRKELLYLPVLSVCLSTIPDQTKSDRNLKLNTHTPHEQFLKTFLFFRKIDPCLARLPRHVDFSHISLIGEKFIDCMQIYIKTRLFMIHEIPRQFFFKIGV